MYAMVCTQPNISHPVEIVSEFMVNPGKDHSVAMKWIFKYLSCSSKLYLSFDSSKPILEGYTYADMVGDLGGKESTQDSYLLLQEEINHGSLKYKNVLPYLQLRLSTMQRLKLGKKCFE